MENQWETNIEDQGALAAGQAEALTHRGRQTWAEGEPWVAATWESVGRRDTGVHKIPVLRALTVQTHVV